MENKKLSSEQALEICRDHFEKLVYSHETGNTICTYSDQHMLDLCNAVLGKDNED